jgi:negative regulator of sigma-B (phosphoserine phosphatase)
MTSTAAASMALSPLPIAWGVSSKAFGAAKEAGDLHVVVPCAQTVLVAAIDGLGHGHEAALAARAAASVLERYGGEPLIELVRRCHEELRRTRGAVLSMASFDLRAGTMTWLGIGNVEGVLFRADGSAGRGKYTLKLRGGVVGYQIPSLRPAEHQLGGGDLLVFATDGIRTNFSARAPVELAVQEIADAILARHGKATDDAMVVVVRYLGRQL